MSSHHTILRFLPESQTGLPAVCPELSEILCRNLLGYEGQGDTSETKYHFANESEAVVFGSSRDVFICLIKLDANGV